MHRTLTADPQHLPFPRLANSSRGSKWIELPPERRLFVGMTLLLSQMDAGCWKSCSSSSAMQRLFSVCASNPPRYQSRLFPCWASHWPQASHVSLSIYNGSVITCCYLPCLYDLFSSSYAQQLLGSDLEIACSVVTRVFASWLITLASSTCKCWLLSSASWQTHPLSTLRVFWRYTKIPLLRICSLDLISPSNNTNSLKLK